MSSRDTFEAHYKSAEVLLRVYRLLEAERGPVVDHKWLPQLRGVLACSDDEELILLFNELIVGVVRERADMRPAFFRRDNLDLLLRQSVVAACSALDVFLPHLLSTHFPDVIQVRQRNFLPNVGEAKSFFKNFSLKLEDIWPLVEEPSLEERWNMLARKVLDYVGNQTLSNVEGVTMALALLGVEQPWSAIARRAGEPEQALRDKLKRIVSRRNDIVHRADRSKTDPAGQVQPIDFVWAQNHVGVIRTVALASYDLVLARVDELKLAAA